MLTCAPSSCSTGGWSGGKSAGFTFGVGAGVADCGAGRGVDGLSGFGAGAFVGAPADGAGGLSAAGPGAGAGAAGAAADPPPDGTPGWRATAMTSRINAAAHAATMAPA